MACLKQLILGRYLSSIEVMISCNICLIIQFQVLESAVGYSVETTLYKSFISFLFNGSKKLTAFNLTAKKLKPEAHLSARKYFRYNSYSVCYKWRFQLRQAISLKELRHIQQQCMMLANPQL